MRALLTLLALVSLPVPLPVLAARLNDSGVTLCTNDGATLVACSVANTGNSGTYPRQDGRFGRDAAQAAGKLLRLRPAAARRVSTSRRSMRRATSSP